MSSTQQSLISGDALAQYRFTLQSLISERLTNVREYPNDPASATDWGLVCILEDLGRLAAELRRVGDVDQAVPF